MVNLAIILVVYYVFCLLVSLYNLFKIYKMYKIAQKKIMNRDAVTMVANQKRRSYDKIKDLKNIDAELSEEIVFHTLWNPLRIFCLLPVVLVFGTLRYILVGVYIACMCLVDVIDFLACKIGIDVR